MISSTFLEELGGLLNWPAERRIVMLWAFVDDSNIHDLKTGAPVVVGHGGAIATYDEWKNLERAWDAATTAESLEKPFHMTDYEKYQDQFKGWSEQRHNNFLNTLLSIIKTHILAYVGYSVPNEQPKTFLKRHTASIGRMLAYCEQESWRSPDGRINLVFANHPEVRSPRITNFLTKAALGFPRIKSFTGATPVDCVALQAADLLAYEFVRWRDAPLPYKARYPIRFLMADATQTFHVFHA